MSWEAIFAMVNLVALLCWVGLIFLPRWTLLTTFIFYAGIGLLCLVYAVLLVMLRSNLLEGAHMGDYSSIGGIRTIFQTDAGIVVGWTHYLAFDLFVGLWIARDADAKGFSRLLQAPLLLLTLLAGPAGLLAWLIIREPAARRANPRKGKLKL